MANQNLFEKLDMGLIMALRAYEANPGERAHDDGISVGLRFRGDIAAIEALGFEAHMVSGDEARGIVRFKDIPALVAHPDVLWIAAGKAPRPMLEVASKDIRAQATSAGSVGTDGLWHAANTTSPLTQVGNATGAGVFVAIIDTGIDFKHPMFMSRVTAPKETRIYRIWDQGMRATALNQCPDVALLQSPNTYGMEFKKDAIRDALNGGPPIDHKDCEGHGTHVAGIAAGGIMTADIAGGDLTKIGVAPEAELIVVKYLDVPDTINFRLVAGFGAEVGPDDRFQDAVMYCLRTARAAVPPRPVVINLSFGSDHLPGDGLDTNARWVDERMDPLHAADATHFPQGAIIVTASGNSGDTSDRIAARIVFPPGAPSSITVPLELKDDQARTTSMRFTNCSDQLHKPDLFFSFWYRRNFDNVKFSVKFPLRTDFTERDMGVGGNFVHGFVIRPGTPPVLVFVPVTPRVHQVVFFHGGDDSVPHPAPPPGGRVRRHHAFLVVTPKVIGTDVTYLEGIYEVRITAPGDTEIFLMGDVADWGHTLATFTIADTMANGSGLDPAVTRALTSSDSSDFTITDALGAHAITVAAYDDRNTVAGADHPIASFSSRGPLRDFSDPRGSRPVVADKPDVAAPGVNINSAQGYDTNVGSGIRVPPWSDGVRFIEHDGTSMSAPMVTGVIALMLQKNHTLNTTDVRNHLRTGSAGRLGNNPPAPGTAHDRAYGSGMVAALESHTATH